MQNQVSSSIIVSAIEPKCSVNCTYIPAFGAIHLDCGSYLCHGEWSLLKDNPDGTISTASISLVRTNLGDIPLAGVWRFWAIGVQPGVDDSYEIGGSAYFNLYVKCKQ